MGHLLRLNILTQEIVDNLVSCDYLHGIQSGHVRRQIFPAGSGNDLFCAPQSIGEARLRTHVRI